MAVINAGRNSEKLHYMPYPLPSISTTVAPPLHHYHCIPPLHQYSLHHYHHTPSPPSVFPPSLPPHPSPPLSPPHPLPSIVTSTPPPLHHYHCTPSPPPFPPHSLSSLSQYPLPSISHNKVVSYKIKRDGLNDITHLPITPSFPTHVCCRCPYFKVTLSGLSRFYT